MTPQTTSLKLASAMFAALWTLGMIWWTGTETANIVALSIAGVVAGILYFFAMRWWLKRRTRASES